MPPRDHSDLCADRSLVRFDAFGQLIQRLVVPGIYDTHLHMGSDRCIKERSASCVDKTAKRVQG